MDELPLPAPDWVRVQTTFSGLCGSDVKQILLNGSRDNPLTALVSFPHVLGHGRCWSTGRARSRSRRSRCCGTSTPGVEVWAAVRPGPRASLASRLGAHAVLSSSPDELVTQVARRVGASPLVPWSKRDWLQDGPAVVYDTIGSVETVET